MIALSIMTAETKREEIRKHLELEELRRLEFESKKPERIENLIEKIFNKAKKEIENSKSCYGVELLFSCDDKLVALPSEFYEALEVVIFMLNEAGYKVNDFHEYSKSWKTRSGRFGSLYIDFD